MRKRIIDHKFVLMSEDEYRMYQKICRSYDRPQFKGEDLFIDHFDSNDEGVILFVKPPTQKYSSLEVYCFLMSLMTNQHLRLMREEVDTLVSETKTNLQSLVEQYQKKLEEISVTNKEEKPVEKAKKKSPENKKQPSGRRSRRKTKAAT